MTDTPTPPTAMPRQDRHFFAEIQPALAGIRLDKALSELLPDHSRAAIQQWLKRGLVLVDGEPAKQKLRLTGGEAVEIAVPAPEPADWPAQPMDFDIIHRDADLLVIDKPAGMVVHPGAGQGAQPIVNEQQAVQQGIVGLSRAGMNHHPRRLVDHQ